MKHILKSKFDKNQRLEVKYHKDVNLTMVQVIDKKEGLTSVSLSKDEISDLIDALTVVRNMMCPF